MKKSIIERLYDGLRSVKLALVLLVLLALCSIAGGIIPQHEAVDFYVQHYGTRLARIIMVLGFNHVFSSVIFLILAALFVVNLTICTFHRITQQFSKKLKNRRHGLIFSYWNTHSALWWYSHCTHTN